MSSDPSGRKGYRRIAPSSVRVRLRDDGRDAGRGARRGDDECLGDKRMITVTFDEQRGYVGQVPALAEPAVALSPGALRRTIEAGTLPDIVLIRLGLDVRARRERETGFIVWPGRSVLTAPHAPTDRRAGWG